MLVRRYSSLALVGGALFATACMASETERLEAISELEQHCGLPAGVLADAYARAEADRVRLPDPAIRSDTSSEERLIYLGRGISDRRILEKVDCIKSFHSRTGYWFNMHAISPTEI